jgi:hypothetical protein
MNKQSVIAKSTNYAANFFKNPNHDFSAFFNKYEENKEASRMKSEIKDLEKALAEKTSAYLGQLNKRYNATYTPLEKNVVIKYVSRENVEYYFDVTTGSPVNSISNAYVFTAETKTGEKSVPSGYCYELGAVVVKTYRYSIPTNNAKINLTLESETVVPMFGENGATLEYKGLEVLSNPWVPYNASNALNNIDATEFVQNFYGINKKVSFSLDKLRRRLQDNKSTEIILRTVEDTELMNMLLSFNSISPVPIWELICTTKADWKYAESLGVLNKFVKFKKNMKEGNVFKAEIFMTHLAKTDKEWIDFLEKVSHWEEDLDFYTINRGGDLATTLIEGYLGEGYRIYYTGFPKHYSFGKFCSYVIDESVNQGYTRVTDFIHTLGDYLRMCDDLHVAPILYSSYLKQTHDIMSRNHKIQVSAEQAKIFAENYTEFQPYKDIDYSVIAPESPADLQKEGDNLNHCVASYIKRVVNKECLILFLRKTIAPLESLVTMEIRNKAIVQAKGQHNRHITDAERNAIIKFAKKRGYIVKV